MKQNPPKNHTFFRTRIFLISLSVLLAFAFCFFSLSGEDALYVSAGGVSYIKWVDFGVTAAAPVAAAAPAEEEGPVAKGPTEVSLILKGLGTGSKVAIIKAVQAITGLGLLDAKKLVDAAPSPVKEHISPVEAEEHKKALVAAGAEVEIK